MKDFKKVIYINMFFTFFIAIFSQFNIISLEMVNKFSLALFIVNLTFLIKVNKNEKNKRRKT